MMPRKISDEAEMVHQARPASFASAAASSSRSMPCALAWAATRAAKSCACFRALRGGGRRFGDEGAHAAQLGEHAVALQLGIGALHGVEIDLQRHRHLAHGGKLAAGLEQPRARSAPGSARAAGHRWECHCSGAQVRPALSYCMTNCHTIASLRTQTGCGSRKRTARRAGTGCRRLARGHSPAETYSPRAAVSCDDLRRSGAASPVPCPGQRRRGGVAILVRTDCRWRRRWRVWNRSSRALKAASLPDRSWPAGSRTGIWWHLRSPPKSIAV